jgi:hypothetical protein
MSKRPVPVSPIRHHHHSNNTRGGSAGQGQAQDTSPASSVSSVVPLPPLDENEIANMLSQFLRSDPREKPFRLNHKEVAQLMRQAVNARNDTQILQSIGCLYALCLSTATTPIFYDDLVRRHKGDTHHNDSIWVEDINSYDPTPIIEIVCCLQAVLVECLIVMKLAHNSIEFSNPSEVLDATDLESIGVYETFTQGLEMAKNLLRDCTHQVRTSSELTSKELEQHTGRNRHKESDIKPAVDCFQPHSLYFMCAFALCHISITVDYKYHINALPGIVESLVGFIRTSGLLVFCTYWIHSAAVLDGIHNGQRQPAASRQAFNRADAAA